MFVYTSVQGKNTRPKKLVCPGEQSVLHLLCIASQNSIQNVIAAVSQKIFSGRRGGERSVWKFWSFSFDFSYYCISDVNFRITYMSKFGRTSENWTPGRNYLVGIRTVRYSQVSLYNIFGQDIQSCKIIGDLCFIHYKLISFFLLYGESEQQIKEACFSSPMTNKGLVSQR